MLSRLTQLTRLPSRFFSSQKPPKGFERFFKRQQQEPPKEEAKHETREEEKKGPDPPKQPKQPNWNRLIPGFIVGGALGLGIYYSDRFYQEEVPDVTFQELMQQYVEPEQARSLLIEINSQRKGPLTNIYIMGSDGKVGVIKVPDVSSFLKNFEYQQKQLGREKSRFVPIEYRENNSKGFLETLDDLGKYYTQIVNIVLIGSVIFMVIRMTGGNKGKGSGSGFGGGLGDLFQMSKPNYKMYSGDNKVGVSFKDVAGLHEAKKEVMEFVEFLKNPEKFKALGAHIPRGALLVGPPGTGKTLLAKATAGEAGVPFFSISGSDFVEMFVGVGASRVRQLFKSAREKAPSIIFIDEIDAVGRKRFGRFGGNEERDNTLNQLLVEMDGFTTDTHVVIMAGTNRRDILDPALLRPGRFDRTVELQLPDLDGRAEILKVHLKPLLLNPELSVDHYASRLAALSPGFSGADLENLCNEAAILAARADKNSVDRIDFENASEKVLAGLERSKKLLDKERRTVAYHEAGHTVVGWFLEGADPVLKVTIQPRSKGALGFAQFLPSEVSLRTRRELLDQICTALGGRVAEEIFFKKITTGASNDIEKATAIAQALVTKFGMNDKLGLIGYSEDSESLHKPYSEDTNRIIDEEVRLIIDYCLDKTRALINEKKQLVENLAELLLEKERATHQDLVSVLGERPFEASEEYAKYVKEGKVQEVSSQN